MSDRVINCIARLNKSATDSNRLILAVRSALAVAKRPSLGSNITAFTAEVWPKKVRRVCPVELKVPATEYKMLIRQAMPVAKATNDTSEYSDVTYVEEGRGFRVHARRHSNLEQHTSPLTLLVEPDAQGRWVIREELSESLAVPPRPQAAQ